MKFVSWNVNGLRACVGKGFLDTFQALDADFFCLQETKLQAGQIELELPGYHQYWCYAQKKGYSGTAIFTRHQPRSVRYGLGIEELDTEGRVITLEYDEFFLVTCYTPNAQRGLARIDHRLIWEEAFRGFLKELDSQKPVILCGDLNVAHQEIDLKNPASNRGNAGFSDEERSAFTALLDSGFTDSFRHLYPNKTGAYSWWSYMFNARQNNAGWRIDYFVVSDRLAGAIHDATIHPDILGSDHCPVGLDLNTPCNGALPFPPEPTTPPDDAPKADGTPSVGLGRILLLFAFLAVLVCAVLHLPKFSRQSTPTDHPTVNMVQVSPMDPPMIAGIINRTGTVTQTIDARDPLSSALQDLYFICGEEWFRVEPLMNRPSRPDLPNFYVQLFFTDPIIEAPDVHTKATHYSNSSRGYTESSFFYQEDGTLGGCFIYGFLPHTTQLSVTLTSDNNSETITIPIVPDFDFEAMSAKELVQLINDSGLAPQVLQDPTLLQKEPTLQELLTRSNAVTTLLDCYSDAPSAAVLLETPDFQTLMNDEQRRTYESYKPLEPPLDASEIGMLQEISHWDSLPSITYLPLVTAGDFLIFYDMFYYPLHGNAGCLSSPLTYCIRIDFTEEYHFVYGDPLPELSVTLTGNGCAHANYYYDDYTIIGCFVYGCVTDAADLSLRFVTENQTMITLPLHISA